MKEYNKQFGEFLTDGLSILKKKGLIKTKKKLKDLTLDDINEFYDEKNDPSYWVDEFVELFPKGVRSKSGYYIRVGKTDLLPKLNKFVEKHKEYTDKELIFQATKNYLNKQAQSGFQMCKMAPWFVEKDGISTLAAECQAIIDNKHEVKCENTELI